METRCGTPECGHPKNLHIGPMNDWACQFGSKRRGDACPCPRFQSAEPPVEVCATCRLVEACPRLERDRYDIAPEPCPDFDAQPPVVGSDEADRSHIVLDEAQPPVEDDLRPCPECHGSGKLDEDGGRQCPTCTGTGWNSPQPPVECAHRKMEYRRDVGGHRFVEPLYNSDALTCIDCRAPMVVLPADVVERVKGLLMGLHGAAKGGPQPFVHYRDMARALLALLPEEGNDGNN